MFGVLGVSCSVLGSRREPPLGPEELLYGPGSLPRAATNNVKEGTPAPVACGASCVQGPPTIAPHSLIQIGENIYKMSVLPGPFRRPICPDFTRLSRLQAAFVRTFYQAYIQRKNRVFLLKIAPDTSHGMSGLPVGIVEALWVMSACGTSI